MHLFSNPDKMILNPYRFAAAGGGTAFGGASREFSSTYISVPYPLAYTDAFSLAFWIKLSSTASLSRGVISIGGSTGDTSPVFLLQSNPRYLPGTSASFYTIGLTDDVWDHVAVTFDGTNSWQVYLNGTGLGSKTHSNNTDADFLYIGNGYIGALNGASRIADVRLYDSVISTSNISDLAAGTDVSSGLVGWWLTDDDDVLDKSGNGNDGTNNGSTYSTDGPLD